MDSVGGFEGVGEDVVACACYCEDDVGRGYVEETVVYAGVFPGEGVDVFLVELGVFLELIIVVDSPVMILVKE